MAKVLNQPWRRTYIELAVYGYAIADLPSADAVWNVYLLDKGLKKYVLPSDCPNCMTVREFSERYKEGRYLLYVGEHVTACINGDYYDTWDSGDRIVIYFFAE
ncbi:MAG: hypothetical protein II453_01745 [Alphaproteobacteria bacterium]|nr:hypothetical protein [Alphaproteobacteria bacterium]